MYFRDPLGSLDLLWILDGFLRDPGDPFGGSQEILGIF